MCQTLREHLAKTHELRHHHRLGIASASFSLFFSVLFLVFFIYLFIFWFDSLLICVLVDLGIEFSYGDKDLVIFYLGLKGGVWVWSFTALLVFYDLEICLKIGLIWWSCWSMYDYEFVCMLCSLGFLGDLDFIWCCVCVCVCLCFMTWCCHVVWCVLKIHVHISVITTNRTQRS